MSNITKTIFLIYSHKKTTIMKATLSSPIFQTAALLFSSYLIVLIVLTIIVK